MGNAQFYYYPEPHGQNAHLVKIDLGEALGEMYSDIMTEAVDAVSLTGSIQRSVGKSQEIVTIQRDRMIGGEDLAIKFHALQNHLDRGFSCAFSADSSKAFCYPVRGSLNAGATFINLYGLPFLSLTGGSVIPSDDDYATLETSSPAMIQEKIKIKDSRNVGQYGGSIQSVDPVNFQYDQTAFLRWHRFFPVLKRPQSDIGQSIITNEGGRLFSLSIRLVVDYQTLFAFHPDTVGETGISIGSQLVNRDATQGVLQGQGGLTIDSLPKILDPNNIQFQGIQQPIPLDRIY